MSFKVSNFNCKTRFQVANFNSCNFGNHATMPWRFQTGVPTISCHEEGAINALSSREWSPNATTEPSQQRQQQQQP
jgi:hypothetical protein